MGLSVKSLLTSTLLLSPLLLVSARPSPSPDPKSAWVRKKTFHNALHGKRRRRRSDNATATESTCSTAAAASITAPKTNIWDGLSDDEAASVVSWLFAQTELNLTVSENATSWDNTVLLVESHRPNKTSALLYLDSNGTLPARYAHVVLDHRASESPYFADILVGPLPISSTTVWTPLSYGTSPSGRVRNIDADSDDLLYTAWLYPLGQSVSDITLDLWDGTATGSDNDTLDVFGIDPLWQYEDGSVIRWDGFWNTPTDGFDAETLLPLGLYVGSNVTGRDPSQWSVLGWLYDDTFFATTEEFREAYWNGSVAKHAPNVEGAWATTDQRGQTWPMDETMPPESVAPGGPRFSVDTENMYVEWMGYTFYLAFSRDTGLALFDVRYEGERLLYELGLQEALAHYAGNDPVQSGTSYLDTFYGFGPFAFELVNGYDCPSHATYLNTSFYVSETTHTHVNSVCLFETTADYPMQRHSTSNYVSATKNTHFTVRSVSTVGNYDYMFSYTFYLDGSIGVEVRASGYIQSAYYFANTDYGFHIHDALSGSMHDHVLNFKADFDILGTANSIQLMSNVPTTETYPWSLGQPRNTMKLSRTFLETEDDGALDWAPNGVTQVLVVNENATNAFGEYRGYRVVPSAATAHLTVVNSTNLQNAARWAEHDLFVTRRKDDEPRSAHPYNSQDVLDPPVDFGKFRDGERLRGEDLVLWVNLGMHHVPHTGDLPNTVFTTAHSGVVFAPSNYFQGDESRRTTNMVRVEYADGVAGDVVTFGREDGTCEMEVGGSDESLWGYTGDVVVRKFPYDPNDPYFDTDSIV